MKKIFVVLIILLAAASLPANPNQLGDFPLGQWLDANYDAVWDFTSNNIMILSTSGRVLYDFSNKTIRDFKVFMEGIRPGISFTCLETGKSYKFLKPLTSGDAIMEIERSNHPKYSVTLKRL